MPLLLLWSCCHMYPGEVRSLDGQTRGRRERMGGGVIVLCCNLGRGCVEGTGHWSHVSWRRREGGGDQILDIRGRDVTYLLFLSLLPSCTYIRRLVVVEGRDTVRIIVHTCVCTSMPQEVYVCSLTNRSQDPPSPTKRDRGAAKTSAYGDTWTACGLWREGEEGCAAYPLPYIRVRPMSYAAGQLGQL